MFKILLTFLLSLIEKFFKLIFSPIISAVTILFPDLSNFFNHITYFINLALTYVTTCLRLLLIDSDMMSAVFSYFLTLYSIFVLVRTVKFITNIYNKFKP